MDCARTAWRLGADEVAILYRRTVEQMPAQREELHALRAEGIAIRELLSPKRIVARDGRLAAARCARMRLGEPDESGRRRPVEVPGAEEEIALDTLIVAISQRADLGLFGDEQPALTRQGFVKVDPATLRTSLPGVYAGGDVVMEGPATIVKALGDAKRIAHDIRAREEGWAPPREEARGGDLAQLPSPQAHPREAAPEGELSQLLSHRARREFRVPLPEAPPRGRRDFHEVLATLSPEAATHEAARCLDCDVLCSQCVAACPNLAFMTYRQEPLALQAPELEKRGGRLVPKATAPFRVEQRFQVAVLTDFCNECGNCTTFCPTSGHPYRDKPRLYLDRREFEEQADNAFHLFRDERGAWGVQARWGGHTHEIVLDDALRYRAPGVAVTLDPGSFAMREAQVAAEVPEGAALTLAPCAAMYALLRGVRDSLPHLPAAAAEDRGEVR
jgi:putative selenate reductase